MKLIENWREAPRMYSMWAFGSIATIQGSVLAFITPEQLSAAILFYPVMTWGGLVQAVVAFLAITGGIGRMIYQPTVAQS
jgi:hypothetical protein